MRGGKGGGGDERMGQDLYFDTIGTSGRLGGFVCLYIDFKI